ncbi:MAG TPA: hypothetical protein DC049_08715 [Spirochaetia bacterium]|nr:hypothetical protein [Spirochaetia bacterium]
MTYKIFLSFFLSIITVFAGQLIDFSKAPANGINQKASHFRYFAPGIINPAEGTLEFTVDIKTPAESLGNEWNFLFLLQPASTEFQIGANTLIGIYLPQLPAKGLKVIFRENQKKSITLDTGFTPDNNGKIRLAVSWGKKFVFYINGTKTREQAYNLSLGENFMTYYFNVERFSPYNTEEIKISSRELAANEISGDISDPFQADESTTLIVSSGLTKAEHFIPNNLKASGYHFLLPIQNELLQIYSTGEKTVNTLLGVNFGKTPVAYQLEIAWNDFQKKRNGNLTQKIELPSFSGYTVHTVSLPFSKHGHYLIKTFLQSADNKITARHENQISVLPLSETALKDGKLASYYASSHSEDWSPAFIKKQGATCNRSWGNNPAFRWHEVEPVKGKFDFRRTDSFVQECLDSGLEVLAVLGYAPYWAGEEPSEEIKKSHEKGILPRSWKPKSAAEWGNYVFKTVSRYKGKVKYYEIYNEVDFSPPGPAASFCGSAEDYFLLLKTSYEQAKKADPECKILISGFSTMFNNEMIDKVFEMGAARYYDIWNIHAYKGADKVLPFTQKALKFGPDKPMWQTEQTWLNVSDQQKRIFLNIDLYVNLLEQGYGRFFNFAIPNIFSQRFTRSPEIDYYTAGVFSLFLRKCDSFSGKYSFTDDSVISLRHYFKRTDGSYLSVIGAEGSALRTELDPACGFITASDIFGQKCESKTEAGVLVTESADIMYIISKSPLMIKKIIKLDEQAFYQNGGFEDYRGDQMGGLSGLIPIGWTVNDKKFDKKGKISADREAQSGKYALALSSEGNGRVYVMQPVKILKPGKYQLSGYFKLRKNDGDLKPHMALYILESKKMHEKMIDKISTDNYIRLSHDIELADADAGKPVVLIFGIKSGAGEILLDNIFFGLEENITFEPADFPDYIFPDMKAAMNDTFSDETADDGQGGFADLGSANLSMLKPGIKKINGLPFNIYDEKTGKSCIILAGVKRPNLPRVSGKIPVNSKVKNLSFLYTALWVKAQAGEQLGNVTVTFKNGKKAVHPLLFRQNIFDWYVPSLPDQVKKECFKISAPDKSERALFTSTWENSSFEEIDHLEFSSDGKGLLVFLSLNGKK